MYLDLKKGKHIQFERPKVYTPNIFDSLSKLICFRGVTMGGHTIFDTWMYECWYILSRILDDTRGITYLQYLTVNILIKQFCFQKSNCLFSIIVRL